MRTDLPLLFFIFVFFAASAQAHYICPVVQNPKHFCTDADTPPSLFLCLCDKCLGPASFICLRSWKVLIDVGASSVPLVFPNKVHVVLADQTIVNTWLWALLVAHLRLDSKRI